MRRWVRRRISRWTLLVVPALGLIVWLVAAQLPRWLAPQPGWFEPDTPGVCAAVASLKLYDGVRADPADGIGLAAARERAEQVAALYYDAGYYDASVLSVGMPLAVQVRLSGESRQAVYLVTVHLGGQPDSSASRLDTDSVIILDAASGDPLRVITATQGSTGAADCPFDVRAALVTAIKSPPSLLLAAYILGAAGLWAARWFLKAMGVLR